MPDSKGRYIDSIRNVKTFTYNCGSPASGTVVPEPGRYIDSINSVKVFSVVDECKKADVTCVGCVSSTSSFPPRSNTFGGLNVAGRVGFMLFLADPGFTPVPNQFPGLGFGTILSPPTIDGWEFITSKLDRGFVYKRVFTGLESPTLIAYSAFPHPGSFVIYIFESSDSTLEEFDIEHSVYEPNIGQDDRVFAPTLTSLSTERRLLASHWLFSDAFNLTVSETNWPTPDTCPKAASFGSYVRNEGETPEYYMRVTASVEFQRVAASMLVRGSVGGLQTSVTLPTGTNRIGRYVDSINGRKVFGTSTCCRNDDDFTQCFGCDVSKTLRCIFTKIGTTGAGVPNPPGNGPSPESVLYDCNCADSFELTLKYTDIPPYTWVHNSALGGGFFIPARSPRWYAEGTTRFSDCIYTQVLDNFFGGGPLEPIFIDFEILIEMSVSCIGFVINWWALYPIGSPGYSGPPAWLQVERGSPGWYISQAFGTQAIYFFPIASVLIGQPLPINCDNPFHFTGKVGLWAGEYDFRYQMYDPRVVGCGYRTLAFINYQAWFRVDIIEA